MTQRAALTWRNWPISWRLLAVVVIAVAMDSVLGGLRLSAAGASEAEFGRVVQLAVLGQQVTGLAQAMEDERDVTAGYIAAGRPASGLALVRAAYAVTDKQAAEVRTLAAGIGTGFPSTTTAEVTTVLDRISDLGGLRDAALRTQLPSLPMITDYSASVSDLFSLNDQIALGSASPEVGDSVGVLGSLSRLDNDVSQQLAILYAAFTERTFEPGALADLIGAQAAQTTDLAAFQASASPADLQSFTNTVTGSQIVQARTLEQRVIDTGGPQTAGLGLSPAAVPAAWYADMRFLLGRQRVFESRQSALIVTESRALEQGPERSALLTATLAGSVLVMVLVATLLVARSLVLPLRRLKEDALDIATVGLPARVHEIAEAADPGDVLAPRPIGVHSTDEIGEVARAFDLVHSEAVRLAGNEAVLRRNVSAMFVSLSRRSQSLTDRLAEVTGSVWQAIGPGQDPRPGLETIEQIVTRMRRNSKNLLVLAGYESLSRQVAPVPVTEVAGRAVAEIEQQTRVLAAIAPDCLLAGHAVTDVTHLLAELLENATSFSPPDSQVRVTAGLLNDGELLIEIADEGVGISADRLEVINQRLEKPPVADASVPGHMGLFAVAHLAQRHGARVWLRPSSPRGLIASVRLPDSISVRGGEPAPPPLAPGPPWETGQWEARYRPTGPPDRLPGRHVTALAREEPREESSVMAAEAARARLGAFQRGTHRAQRQRPPAGQEQSAN